MFPLFAMQHSITLHWLTYQLPNRKSINEFDNNNNKKVYCCIITYILKHRTIKFQIVTESMKCYILPSRYFESREEIKNSSVKHGRFQE